MTDDEATRILSFAPTDLGNSERFLYLYRRQIRYVNEWKGWLMWDGVLSPGQRPAPVSESESPSGGRWQRDISHGVHRLAAGSIRELKTAISHAVRDKDERIKQMKSAERWESIRRLRAIPKLAADDHSIRVSAESLDADPFLLNCENGTVDLRTGELKPPDPGDLITKNTGVAYDTGAEAPKFQRFLRQLFVVQDTREWFQRVAGYCASGDVSEKAVFFLIGEGSNGKTTLLRTLRHILGEYAGICMVESLMRTSSGSTLRSADIANLAGKRLVTTAEPSAQARLHEAQLKALSGMDSFVAARKYENPVIIRPNFKIFVEANTEPIIEEVGDAVWGRAKLIRLNARFSGDAANAYLFEELREEAPAILTWAVLGGLLRRQENGLRDPMEVRLQVAEWQRNMDRLQDFGDTYIESESGLKDSLEEIWAAAKEWAKANDIRLSQRTLTDFLKRRYKSRSVSDGRHRWWLNIRLKDEFRKRKDPED